MAIAGRMSDLEVTSNQMVYRGRVKNGEIVLDPGVRLPDGAEVRIELAPIERPEGQRGRDPLFQMADLAVETGISDLATNIDHYLYGHPKVGDAE